MIGLLAIAVAGCWIAFSVWLSRRIGDCFKKSWAQFWGSLLAFGVLLPLPVADELLTLPIFNALCKEGAVLKVNEERIRGRKIREVIEPNHQPVGGTPVPILRTHFSLRDVNSQEELAQYDTYVAVDGILARGIGFPVISIGGCAPPKGSVAYAEEYGFNLGKR